MGAQAKDYYISMKGNPLKDQNPQEWKSQTSGPFLSFENIIRRNVIDYTNDNYYIEIITEEEEFIRPRRRNLFETQFQYM